MRSGLARVVHRAVKAPVLAIAIASVTLSFVPIAASAEEGRAASVQPAASAEITEARMQIDSTLAEMRVTAVRVRDQLRLARRRGTKQQVMCVDEALSRADVALRHARELGDEIVTAYRRGDGDAARAARGQLSELRALERFASVQATKCTPSATPAINLLRTNTVTVKVDVDPNIARVD